MKWRMGMVGDRDARQRSMGLVVVVLIIANTKRTPRADGVGAIEQTGDSSGRPCFSEGNEQDESCGWESRVLERQSNGSHKGGQQGYDRFGL